MPEMHLKWPGFTYNVCDPFNKIYLQKQLDKLVFNILWLMEILTT